MESSAVRQGRRCSGAEARFRRRAIGTSARPKSPADKLAAVGPRYVTPGVALLLALPVPCPAQPAVLSPPYEAALRRYVSGDRDGAVAAAAALSERELREQVEALRSLWKRARVCAPCAESVAWQQAPVPAALMLHTDCSLSTGRGRTSARSHESAAVAIATLMKDDPARHAFARRWYEAVAGVVQGENRWGEALDWAERGIEAFPSSAELLLALGAIEETIGAEATPRWPEGLVDPNARQTQLNLARLLEVREHLQRAHRVLRDAVAADPSLLEARLRLGRVAWRLGKPAEARVALAEVLARSRARDTVFLAHLFLGRLHEDADRLDDAARSYEAALALHTRCQSARLALSHVLWRRGDPTGARREVEAALERTGDRRERDPFWQYPWGSAVGAEERLETLRREASS